MVLDEDEEEEEEKSAEKPRRTRRKKREFRRPKNFVYGKFTCYISFN